jgi:uncharacterized repeat protein (TIGR03833 family)
MSLPLRSEIRPGLKVQIVEKQNQRNGAGTEGVVARTLRVTSSPTHPHGIATGSVPRLHLLLHQAQRPSAR